MTTLGYVINAIVDTRSVVSGGVAKYKGAWVYDSRAPIEWVEKRAKKIPGYKQAKSVEFVDVIDKTIGITTGNPYWTIETAIYFDGELQGVVRTTRRGQGKFDRYGGMRAFPFAEALPSLAKTLKRPKPGKALGGLSEGMTEALLAIAKEEGQLEWAYDVRRAALKGLLKRGLIEERTEEEGDWPTLHLTDKGRALADQAGED